jgi:hypothetical protein
MVHHKKYIHLRLNLLHSSVTLTQNTDIDTITNPEAGETLLNIYVRMADTYIVYSESSFSFILLMVSSVKMNQLEC